MVEYPPYVFSYGNLKNLLDGIKKASVPTKFNRDFLSTMLGLKSSSYHAMIPFMKKIGFIDQSNTPTQFYKDFRDDEEISKRMMTDRIKEVYSDIFQANEYAYKLDKQQLMLKIKNITGAGEDDKIIPAVIGTFQTLCEYADFESTIRPQKIKKEIQPRDEKILEMKKGETREIELGISYTINLNLPATNDIEVFNAIFKSLKEHILNER